MSVEMKKTIVFTVTSGRSGTKYLANIIDLFDRVNAYHEPYPSFVLKSEEVLKNNFISFSFWENKMKYIQQSLLSCDTYVETNHVFCKGFIPSMVYFSLLYPSIKFKFLLLNRNIRNIAKSFYLLDAIPNKNTRKYKYLFHPRDDICKLHIPKKLKKLHDYQLCYWYALEIEEHKKFWRESNLIETFDTSISELQNKEHIEKLSIFLNTKIDKNFFEKWDTLKNKRINTKIQRKKEIDLDEKLLERMEIELTNMIIKRV